MQSLSGVKILDLTHCFGEYTSKLLADLGAEVIRVEPLDGCASRKKGPFYKERKDDLNASQYFWYNNTNKKSIAVDYLSREGCEIVKKMIQKSDILVESFEPGTMEKWGMAYDDLRQLNPSLVMTSITPFGQNGPFKHYQATDLIGVAMGGLMNLGGEPDRSPVRAYGEQAYFAASAYGAVGTLIAFYHAEATGEGEHVDVSIQESVSIAMENAIQYYDLQRIIRKRIGSGQHEAGWGMYPCKDGYLYLMIGGLGLKYWDSLVDWMEETGFSEQAHELRDSCWKDVAWRSSEEGKERFRTLFSPFTLKFNKLQFYEEGQQRKIAVCPINDPKDIYQNPQLQHRNFFVALYHEDWNEIIYPGPPYRLSATPWEAKRRAPKLGEHTMEVLSELYPEDEVKTFVEKGVVR